MDVLMVDGPRDSPGCSAGRKGNHPDLTLIDPESAKRELADSQPILIHKKNKFKPTESQQNQINLQQRTGGSSPRPAVNCPYPFGAESIAGTREHNP